MFGEVEVRRLAYRARGSENLYIADAQLNLPAAKHSDGLRRPAALEAPRTSFEDAQAAIVRQTGQQLGKRQIRELAVAALPARQTPLPRLPDRAHQRLGRSRPA